MERPALSERQQRILSVIVEEFIKNAEPVGSEYLVRKYGFSFSPATLRNEMAVLGRLGLIEKSHFSAGRVPTPQAFRYFIRNLMKLEELPVVNEVALKQRLWSQRHDMERLLREVVASLAQETQNLSLIITDEGKVYSAGAAHILRHPEFYDIDVTQTVLQMLDDYELLEAMFSRLQSGEYGYAVLLGPEIGVKELSKCGTVVARFDLPQGHVGHMGVFGPYRLDYPRVVPVVKYLHRLIHELSQSW